MDLNSILNTGVDPSTGKYMSPGERKEAFRKSMGMGYASATKKGSTRPPIKPGSALVRRDKAEQERVKKESALVKQQNNKLISKLDLLTKLANNLFQMRSERVRLEQKYAETKRKVEERERRKSEEQSMESSGGKFGSKFLDKVGNKAAKAVGFGLFDLLKGVLSYGILNWISKPENKEAVEMMVKGFMGLFKVFSFFVSTAVNATLGGFTKLFGGGSILERIFGFFEMIGGIFLFRRVLNPLKLIGDLKWVIKNLGNFRDIFKALRGKNLAKAGDAVKKLFPKAASLFKKGIQGSVQRIFLKIFGKGITKFIKPIAKTVVKTVVRPLAGVIKRVPVIGTLLAIPINMFLGDPIDKAIVKAIGATLGTFVVGALGSIIPGAGTVLGGIAGGLLGDWLAGWLYDGVIAPLGKTIQKSMPQLNTGGIASGPDEGYKVTLHGTEAVIPIDKLSSTILEPYKTVASAVIGGTLAVLKSMGPIGALMGPVALQMFNPFIRIFGFTASTFVSGLGKGSELLIPSAQAREFPDVPASKEEMVEKTKRGGKKGDGTGKEESTGDDPDVGPIEGGPMHQKGANIAKKLMSLLSIKDYQAAGIVGNLIQESALVPDRIQGKPPSQGGALKVDGVTGYSYPQWTSIDRQRNFAKYMESKGFDWKTKGATDEMATGFLVKEFKQAMSSRFTNTKNAAEASNWVLFNYERPADQGTREQKERAHDAQKVLSKMSEGGLFQEKKYQVFQQRKQQRDFRASGDGRPPSKFATGGKAILEGAKSIAGMGRGQGNMCAATTRAALAATKHPAAEKRTTKGDLDSKGTQYNGRNFAASFAGSDMGTVIRSSSSLAAGDIVLWKGGNGFGSGEITHVGIKGEGNDLWHHGTSSGFRKASMYTSYGGQTFAAGIRLDGAPGTTESSPDSAPETGEDDGKTTEKKTGFMGSGVNTDDLIYLLKNLGVSAGPSTPTPTPSAAPASSALPSMSSNFTLDKKMSAITSKISETVIVQQGSNNFSNISVSSLPLNTFISTTDVLNKL